MQSKVGNTKTIRITFDPENTTDKNITWVLSDETALEYVPVPNDNELRIKTKKAGTYNVVITSVANTELTQTVTFTVTN